MNDCTELVARCFAARTAAHFAHLTTRSYAQHMALGDFYDAIAAAADEFIECHMGVEGKIDQFPDVPVPKTKPLEFLSDLSQWVREHRESCAGDSSELANMIDNILAIIDRTYYKVKFLS